jgi:GNAT superfamily N-acetyltransferase
MTTGAQGPAPQGGPVADSVRLAWPREAAALAALQRRSWAELPAPIGQTMLAGITLAEMTEVWHGVITRPPQATFRVLVAVRGADAGANAEDAVVGFATTSPSPDADADPAHHGEIDQFVIDPPARHRGHGSRLLNACADTLRADGFTQARWWLLAEDDTLRRFLLAAGWAPDGAHRELGTEDAAVRIKQVRLHTDLSEAD